MKIFRNSGGCLHWSDRRIIIETQTREKEMSNERTISMDEAMKAWREGNDAGQGFAVGKEGQSPREAAKYEGWTVVGEADNGAVLIGDSSVGWVMIADSNGPWAVWL
jgi:hypothetical protein